MKCPICNVDLTMSERQGIEIDYCPTCRGVWLDRGELDKIIERSQATPAETSQGVQAHMAHMEYNRHYKDKHHEEEHGRYSHKGHKRKSFLSELFD